MQKVIQDVRDDLQVSQVSEDPFLVLVGVRAKPIDRR